jgi:hypothetical protein
MKRFNCTARSSGAAVTALLLFVFTGCGDRGAGGSGNAETPAAAADAAGSEAAGSDAGRHPSYAVHAPESTAPSGQLPPGHPPIDGSAGQPGGVQPGAMQGGTMLPPVGRPGPGKEIGWTVPAGWVEVPPANPMRRAQYRVPGPAGDGECVVFYFGTGQGGDPESNARRWAEQFTTAGGAPAGDQLKTSRLEVGGMKVLMVEVAGTYAGGGMMGPPQPPKPGSMLLGAVAEGPDANWFFKFTGPEKTVRAGRTAFETMIKSLRKNA